jgi:uncharacterized protein (TIGR02271 family)
MNELLACGFSRDEVQLSSGTDNAADAQGRVTTDEQSSGSAIGNFFRNLFGMDEDRRDRDVYSEAVRRGSCVLTVHADSEDGADKAADVMNRFNPVDVDERSTYWRSQGWSGYDESAPMFSDQDIENERSGYAARQNTGQETRIPVVEEQIKIGKRAVQRGGVRVYTRVTEKPVQESVDLRQEHVKVERHAVDQPATEADMAAFKEGSVELRETAEEAVVSKSARVVEEVVVGKEVTQETENINDTVRKTDVEVEQLDASSRSAARDDYADTTAASFDSDYRTHWQNAYGQSGGRYEDYDAAYRYGSTMAGSDRYKNGQWEDAEPHMRREWESSHPESTWDKVKDAVRYGAERVTGRR